MAQRKKVGIIHLNWGASWTGGYYYIINLINAFHTLSPGQKPIIWVFCEKEEHFLAVKKDSQYPLLKFAPLKREFTKAEKLINRIGRKLFRKKLIPEGYTGTEVDILFPYQQIVPSLDPFEYKKVYWIPDFQERHLPHFFSQADIQARKAYQEALASRKDHIIFSSQNARQDFVELYPDHQTTLHVLNFAVTHPAYTHLKIEELYIKYHISQPYFSSPNQFWAHKNHIVVIKAVEILRDKGYTFNLLFSGNENDNRNPDYFPGLLKYVKQHKLETHIKFLGFIDRIDLLQLMNHALAVIQPSLFEGWSTVVEDAKAMNQYLLLSDLAVHQEQIDYNVSFFDPNAPEQLAGFMQGILDQGKPHRETRDYTAQIKKFATNFLSIAEHIQ